MTLKKITMMMKMVQKFRSKKIVFFKDYLKKKRLLSENLQDQLVRQFDLLKHWTKNPALEKF